MVKPKKIVFEEPVVRIKVDRIRFPKICPVCCSEATTSMKLFTTPGRKQYLRPSLEAGLILTRKSQLYSNRPPMKILVIPVCENHVHSDDDYCRLKLLCIVSNGIILALAFFALMVLGDNLWTRQPIEPWVFLIIGIFLVSISMLYITFQSGPIQTYVRIIGYDVGLQNIMLQFKNPEYRDAFIHENPMTAELVRWIIKS